MAGSHTKFKGVSRIGDSLLNEQLKANIVSYIDYALLEIGAFNNINTSTSGYYGGNEGSLKRRRDPNYTDGQVWEAFRSNWVWESGLDITSPSPIRVSGVFINGLFKPTSGVSYTHTIDYPRGRVIFDNPIGTSSGITLNYSYKWVNVRPAEEAWFRELQFKSFRVDSPHFTQFASGDWSKLAESRIQLPVVLVEVPPVRAMTGLQLGGGQKIYQDIHLNIFAETDTDRNQLVDIFTYQRKKQLYLYNLDTISQHRLPLDNNGSPQVSGFNYPMLVEASGNGGFFWNEANIFNVEVSDVFGPFVDLYTAQVRWTLEIEMHGL